MPTQFYMRKVLRIRCGRFAGTRFGAEPNLLGAVPPVESTLLTSPEALLMSMVEAVLPCDVNDFGL